MGFLFHAPSHGYELHQQLLKKLGNIWHASQSQTYNIIKRLEAQGFIQSTLIDQGKHPARQDLQLTTSGNERFITWLTQPTKSSVHAIRVEFITRLYFTHLYFPEQTQIMIHNQLEVVRSDAIRLRQELDKLPETQAFNRLALELRLDLLSSVIAWLDVCSRLYLKSELGRNEDA